MKFSGYYRIFTDLLPKGFKKIAKSLEEYILLFLIILLIAFSYIAFNLYNFSIEAKNEKAVQEQKLVYWEKVVEKSSNYPDGWYNAAYFSLRLNERDKALMYLKKALNLDPNFQKADDLKNKIEKL